MKVRRLVLKNFRNYSELSWSPHPLLNVIEGNNAQGKTNLLEAIFFCTAGRSFRTAREKEIINWNEREDECRAGVELEKSGSSLEISVSLNNSGRTAFFLNGRKQNKRGIFQPPMSVSFTPTDLDLVRGSPSERRKWLDLELGPFQPQYLQLMDRFEKVVCQRNILLKKYGGSRNLKETVEPWDEQMFHYGSLLINARIRWLKALFPHVREVCGFLTGGKEEVSYLYLSSVPLERGMDPEGLPGLYRETVRKRFAEEMSRQQTLFGPHRDDLVFLINGSDARKFGSRGQQRSLVLALKISLMRLFWEEYGEYPVLLLDDVFLELDRERQQALERLLRGEAQVFITADRLPPGLPAGGAGTCRAAGGKIEGGEE